MVYARTCIVIYLHSPLIAYLKEAKCEAQHKVLQTHYKFPLSMSKNLTKSEQDKFALLLWAQ